MGCEVYADDPKSGREEGHCFVRHEYWWRPLWDYVCKVCSDIISEEEKDLGDRNDGCFISKEKADRIADRLDSLVRDGSVLLEETAYRKMLEELPYDICHSCNGLGVAVENKYGYQGKCEMCEGKGKVKNEECPYRFGAENVKEFAWFCRQSGGFRIH